MTQTSSVPANAELEFPVTCRCKVIGADQGKLAGNITRALHGLGIDQQPVRGQESRGGKYVTYHVTLTFEDKETMRRTFHVLKQVPDVKMVL